MNSTKTLLGFVMGASVGVLAGILFAPEKGSETRKKIAQKTNDLGNSLQDSANGYIEKAKDSISNLKSDAKNGKEQIISKADSPQQETRNQWS